ncbi:MAG: cation-translocating P-type ATPase, partial [Leptospiraceae bacterium]|nr:cation-translocating P-type ATPase [Leptospiraceae bacterium]
MTGDINDPRPETITVAVRDVVPGDVLLLQSGETIPADGLLIAAPLLTHPETEGDSGRNDPDGQGPLSETCEVDESVLTGESRAVERKAGDRLLAGSIVVRGAVMLRVTSAPAESSLAALSRLAEGAGHGGSDYERLTRRIIPTFSMIVLLAAALAFGFHYYIGAAGLDRSLIIAISVLIISCPCALALAVPTATGAAIYLGLRRGVLIRDGNVLQRMTNVHRFFFDKTGTLTEGRPRVTAVRFFYDQLEVLRHVARIEKGSVHPLGQALLEYARTEWQRSAQTASFFAHVDPHHDVRIIAGKGVQMEIPSTDETAPVALRLGSVRFIQEQVTDVEALDAIAQFRAASPTSTVLGLSIQNRLLALFALSDVPRPDARQAVSTLTAEFSDQSPIMLTGDDHEVARHIGLDLGFADANIESGLLPNEKIARIAAEREAHPERTIAMVGDGYNDAPALAAASLALVMARGAPLSLEHAGVILLNNRPMDIVGALRLARRALRVVRINFGISFFYNAIMIPLAMAGYLLPIWCALAMASSSLLVIASSSMF